MESYLNQVFEDDAARISSQISGKTAVYRLEAMGYTVDAVDDGKTGICQILSVVYNRKLDCNVYRLKDVETGEEFSVTQFEVWLELKD